MVRVKALALGNQRKRTAKVIRHGLRRREINGYFVRGARLSRRGAMLLRVRCVGVTGHWRLREMPPLGSFVKGDAERPEYHKGKTCAGGQERHIVAKVG
jgi:hypothetical protein